MKSINEMLETSKGHQEWIPLLEIAAREVFELMLGCKLAPLPDSTPEEFDITSMVGLAGQVCGMLSIRCAQKAAVIMSSKMLGAAPGPFGPEVQDAFGEIANMVAGNFKNKVSGLGDACMLSVPTVITGNDFSVHALSDTAGLEFRFLFEGMPVAIILEIHS
jgi:chemotaxis protein CheX